VKKVPYRIANDDEEIVNENNDVKPIQFGGVEWKTIETTTFNFSTKAAGKAGYVVPNL
jgi:hypothetical protein